MSQQGQQSQCDQGLDVSTAVVSRNRPRHGERQYDDSAEIAHGLSLLPFISLRRSTCPSFPLKAARFGKHQFQFTIVP
jgi:hypothetical protein